jgi:hypothetical protein
MVGYFSLTLPAGMGLYWLANNVFTTATTYYLKELGGATVTVPKLERPKLKLGTAIRSAPAEGGAEGAAEGSVLAADAGVQGAGAAPAVSAAVTAAPAAPAVAAAAVAAAPAAAAVPAAASAAAPADASAPAPAAAAAVAAAVVVAPPKRNPRRCKRMKDPAARKLGRPTLAA